MRLINANALINRIVFHTDWTTDEKEAFEDEINAEPTIEERKTGKWIDGYKRQRCSICRYNGVRSWEYCPNCGAKMVQEGEEHG